ncbi:MAG: phosphate signaling complex protein PhoU [Chloroflexota bacterium]|nr:phosphate signaling complex protein PhoU [Chloroflexota bacterium]MDE2942171.1 phosphate signaling complex protein PhoU [Chloroflexota bacterium]MDE3267997.1 phosphate signaling complex protein PhoU [Chloroflexota bacterium]
MVRTDFDRHLRMLQSDLLILGSMVEKAIAKSLDALKRRDAEGARQVIREDDFIDSKRYNLEEQCIELIATQQPMAGDLRSIITMLHIAVELERMGDYAEGIAKICLMMEGEPPLKPLIDLPRMSEMVTDMLRRSLDSLVHRDTVAALAVCNDDDDVDALYDQVYRELIFFMVQDTNSIQRATYLLWVAHDLERIADRATNIAERVIFMVTGKMTEINVSRY